MGKRQYYLLKLWFFFSFLVAELGMRMFKSFSLLKKQNEIVCKVNILMCTDYTEFQNLTTT